MALFGDARPVFCLFLAVCCYWTGELTDKVILYFDLFATNVARGCTRGLTASKKEMCYRHQGE